MDLELRAYLEAMEQRAVARDAETRQHVDALAAKVDAVDAKVNATRTVAEAALSVAVQARDVAAAAKQGIEAARTEARAFHEDTWEKIEGMKDGLSTHQHAESDRLDAAREEAMLNHHVLPLEASAISFAERLARHDKEIQALQQQ